MSKWNIKYPYVNDEILNLDWVISKVKEFQTTLAAWEVLAEELQAGLADINGIKEDIADINTNISTIKHTLKEELEELEALRVAIKLNANNIDNLEARVKALEDEDVMVYIDKQLRLLREQIGNYLNQMINLLDTYQFNTDVKIQKLSDDLDRKYKELLDLINEIVPTEVFNRVAGRKLSLNDNNFNVYEDLRDLGMSNAEVASFGISNEYLASIVLNNRDFAINLKNRLHRFNLFSPLTGVRTTHANAISEVIFAILNGDSNEVLYNQMEADEKTNSDLADYYESNMQRYVLHLS